MIKKIIAAVLAAMTLGACACGKGDSSDTGKNKTEIWSVNAAKHVLQDSAYDERMNYDKSVGELRVSLAKSEAEDAQIIFTPQRDVKSFELITSPLKCGEATIPADDISVYVQRYIYCYEEVEWIGYYGIRDNINPYETYYPDMLMDMETCKKYGENTVKAGNNQGISVTFTTHEDTAAGTYTGEFDLKIDNETFKIPVSVTVWNFSLAKVNGRTLFYPQDTTFINNEFDNTTDMYRKYYETCLSYKIDMEYLPGHTSLLLSSGTEDYIAEINKYWDNPAFNTFALPAYEMGQWGKIDALSRSTIKEYLLAVARASTPEKNLFDKMVICHDSLDEPYLNPAKMARLPSYYQTFAEIENEVISTLENEGFFASFTAQEKTDFCNKIKNIPQIVTGYIVDDLTYNGEPWSGSNVNAWCPLIDGMETIAKREKYDESVAKGGEKWFYTCNQPQFPYPCSFIESCTVANRVLRWMQFDSSITGFLYWAPNFAGKTGRDPYNTAPVWSANPNGDGYFFYPGKAYDHDPFPSFRLHQFRDGQEDMDMLYLFRDKFISVAKNYGMNEETAQEKFSAMQSIMFDRIIDGVLYNFDETELLSLREEIAAMITALDAGVLVSYDIDGTECDFNVYTKDKNLKLNGENVTTVQTTGGYVYHKNYDLKGGAFSFDIACKDVKVAAFVSKGRKNAELGGNFSFGGNAGTVCTVSNGTVIADILTQTSMTAQSYIEIPSSVFATASDFSKIDCITFTLKNYSDESFVVSVLLSYDGDGWKVEEIPLTPGEERRISLPLIYNIQYAHLGKMNALMFEVPSDEGKVLRLGLSRLAYSVK